MTRRSFLASAGALMGLGAAGVKAAAPMQVFEGHLKFDPVTLDQVPFTWEFRAPSWRCAFAEVDRVKSVFASIGMTSWSHGVKGPWQPR